jgi:hypothetical protein
VGYRGRLGDAGRLLGPIEFDIAVYRAIKRLRKLRLGGGTERIYAILEGTDQGRLGPGLIPTLIPLRCWGGVW